MKKAFTLVELMLVVIIIGVLASLVVPRLTGRVERAKNTAAKADVEANLSSAIDAYEVDGGAFPASLEDLMRAPADVKNWHGPYLKKMPKDPWGKEYYYRAPGDHSNDYDLASMGKNGTLGDDDDIVNWE